MKTSNKTKTKRTDKSAGVADKLKQRSLGFIVKAKRTK